MAGPSTEYLAEQLDKIRDELQAARREALDGSRRVGDIFASQLQDIRENMVDEFAKVRGEYAASRESLKMEQSLIREDLAALKAQTTALAERFDRTQDFLKQLLFWLLGSIATVGGAVFWKAAQAVNRLDEHGRRIEVVEKEAKEDRIKSRESFDKLNENQARLGASLDKLNENQTRLGESLDQFRKTFNERLPAAPLAPR